MTQWTYLACLHCGGGDGVSHVNVNVSVSVSVSANVSVSVSVSHGDENGCVSHVSESGHTALHGRGHVPP